MDTNMVKDYRKHRAAGMPAKRALDYAKHTAKMRKLARKWSEGRAEGEGYSEVYTREVGPYTVKLVVTQDSQGPVPDGKRTRYCQSTDYGDYVGAGHTDYIYPAPPAMEPPFKLPVAHYRWPSHEQHAYEYFFPSYMDDQYEGYRKAGDSKSVARDRLAAWLESWLSDLHNLCTYYIRIKVVHTETDVELADTYGYQSDTIDYPTLEDALSLLAESDLIHNAIEEARANLAKLHTLPTC